MLAVIFGLIFMILGIWGVVIWWPDFLGMVKGLVPFMIVCGGFLAVVAGITGIVDSSRENRPEKEEEKKEG